MLHSMTGYGKAVGLVANKSVSVEIKTLNSKTNDLYAKIPNQYKEMEVAIRQVVTDELTRGKMDLVVAIDTSSNGASAKINQTLAKAYYEDLKATADLIGQTNVDYLSLITRMPEIYTLSSEELSDENKAEILAITKQACDLVNTFRRQEGLALENEFTTQINEIKKLLANVDQYEEERIQFVRQRLLKALEEIGTYDESRYHQELIYYVEKLDISEEKMRLTNHLDYFLKTMNEETESGKKLGFITQEIGREINTLGSKCTHTEIQKLVVGMKDALEKIKEQVLNTL
ncbi:MAG TPA: YicC family protein [Crocinitomicaceae bacterium]|jgi:uncharacterized protein (TIGR00255 family)|nr:YicC family protein [Crocinitomicaceae bacterium]